VPNANVVTTQCEASRLDSPRPANGASLELRVGPNPCSGSATVHLVLPVAADVALQVVDAAGRRVCDLHHGWQPAGAYEVRWDGTALNGTMAPSGLYFVQVVANGETRTARLLLMR
jgi:flagellar hook assembly protein FlgD